ncbi:tumor necrosis factor receptor superfamily member 22 isoform X2 [Cricetulus griseus]|uniref:Tumor necrosis factor receptor superfamily member 22 isoform X2 n=1 Tax=Cricetulus griseus TaxID=10029 RepID=A0A9J7FRQ9_CRIGR|nr:tumor necrosis factor receptor superfamily member 22 isoform X2 [Cricetulus griseus]XP_027294636.1 tumor necrosis factor receptor superfamily member 22 isoform X2 [Cricetulus griseus]
MIFHPVSVSNLGRCLQLYLLVQLQLTTMPEPLYRQSKNCSTDEHLSGDHCCKNCSADQEKVADCSATSDRKCQCRMGHFYSDPGSSEFCRQCTKCPQGVPVLQRCNSTSNTVCGLAATSHRNRLYLLMSLLVLLVIAIVCCCLKKQSPCRCHHCMQSSGDVTWEQMTG